MSKTIYCRVDYTNVLATGETNWEKRITSGFSNQPSTENDRNIYDNMSKKVSLKYDFKWHERYELENMIEKFGFWSEFPTHEYLLIDYEHWIDHQFVDLLYLRNDGKVIPCEIKIGGNSKDAHGQLIRYMASLEKEKINKQWVNDTLNSYLKKIAKRIKKKDNSEKIKDLLIRDLTILTIRDNFKKFISKNNIKSYNFLHKNGLIFDEDFKPQLINAVNYLNNQCEFCIKLFKITTFVQDCFNKDEEKDYFYKLVIDEYDGKKNENPNNSKQ